MIILGFLGQEATAWEEDTLCKFAQKFRRNVVLVFDVFC